MEDVILEVWKVVCCKDMGGLFRSKCFLFYGVVVNVLEGWGFGVEFWKVMGRVKVLVFFI